MREEIRYLFLKKIPSIVDLNPPKNNQKSRRDYMRYPLVDFPGVYLTHQEFNCTKLLVKGMRNKEIACEMKLSRRTVEAYLEKVRQKLNCRNRKALMISMLGKI